MIAFLAWNGIMLSDTVCNWNATTLFDTVWHSCAIPRKDFLSGILQAFLAGALMLLIVYLDRFSFPSSIWLGCQK